MFGWLASNGFGLSEQPEKNNGNCRGGQCPCEQSEWIDALTAKRLSILQDPHPGRVGCIGDHGESSTGHCPSDEGVFELRCNAFHERAEVMLSISGFNHQDWREPSVTKPARK